MKILKEFNNLMKEYNLNLKMNLHKNHNKKFTVNDLYPKTINYIQNVYKRFSFI